LPSQESEILRFENPQNRSVASFAPHLLQIRLNGDDNRALNSPAEPGVCSHHLIIKRPPKFAPELDACSELPPSVEHVTELPPEVTW